MVVYPLSEVVLAHLLSNVAMYCFNHFVATLHCKLSPKLLFLILCAIVFRGVLLQTMYYYPCRWVQLYKQFHLYDAHDLLVSDYPEHVT
jgi:hypothetical protein